MLGNMKAFLNAAGTGATAAVDLTLSSGSFKVDDEDKSRVTALHRAAAGGHVDTVCAATSPTLLTVECARRRTPASCAPTPPGSPDLRIPADEAIDREVSRERDLPGRELQDAATLQCRGGSGGEDNTCCVRGSLWLLSRQ